MELLDPATGNPLPSDAIQRVLFISNTVHVYNIPPLSSTRGHNAASWTADPSRHIFTARLRIVETSYDDQPEQSTAASSSSEKIKVDVVLEDPSTGQLFAAAPYTDRANVEPALDSSRFFAVTVRDPSGRKATLGIGFEERSEAFDMGVALQEASRTLGLDGGASGAGAVGQHGARSGKLGGGKEEAKQKDYSLKEGETITIDLGSNKFHKRLSSQHMSPPVLSDNADLQSFALAPPPSGGGFGGGGGGGGGLPPPPSAKDVKRKRLSARDLGFDDGQFGEFA